jgi:hypothetical protein
VKENITWKFKENCIEVKILEMPSYINENKYSRFQTDKIKKTLGT